MDLSDIRRNNLELLISKAGSARNLNELLGRPRTDATFSQITRAKATRVMGHSLARKIEETLKLPMYWMDAPQKDAPFEARFLVSEPVQETLIPAAGDMHPAAEGTKEEKDFQLSRSELDKGKNIYGLPVIDKISFVAGSEKALSELRGLKLFTIDDSAMSPTLQPGDSVIVNTDVKKFSNGLFVLSMGGDIACRRVQLIPMGIRLLFDSRDFPPIDSYDTKKDGIECVGKVNKIITLRTT